MKLAPVLFKYLATNKELELPGIGIFRAEPVYDAEGANSDTEAPRLNISFEQGGTQGFDERLIHFVSEETGKMKVLSESDLRSEIEEVHSFLNTGKPYYIEGIGTFTQKADKSLEFHQERHQKQRQEKKKAPPVPESNYNIPKTYSEEPPRRSRKKSSVVILIFCLFAIITTIWFYIKNTEKNNAAVVDVTEDVKEEMPAPSEQTTDSSELAAATPGAASTYKYVLEKTRQPRASKRFAQLKKLNWPVAMETTDSLGYTLFISLPAANADTARIKDSLTVLSGRKVWIEQ